MQQFAYSVVTTLFVQVCSPVARQLAFQGESQLSYTSKRASLLRVKNDLEDFFQMSIINEYYVNPILIITFIPKVPTSCGNSSILICNCPLKGHSSRKYLFEIVGHASRILSKASVSIFEHFRQWVKGRKERSSLGDTKSGFLYSSKIR